MLVFREKKIIHLIFFLYAIMTAYIVWYHEPWLDEAQAWLIARDCNIEQLFAQMKYEGTPALWHFILMPLAKYDFPYFSMQVIHWIFAVGMMYLFLYHSPFSLLTKGGITFSYIMMYEYVIKARCYNISILLLFAIATFYSYRIQRPILYSLLIGLLCQTNLLCMPAAFGLSLVFLWEITFQESWPHSKKLYFCTILLLAISGIFAFWQIYPPKSATPYSNILGFGIPVVKLWRVLQEYLANKVIPPGAVFQYSTEVKYSLEIAFNLFLLGFFALLVVALRKTRIIWFLICSVPFIWGIQSLLAKFHTRHYGFYVILPLTAIWIYMREIPAQNRSKLFPIILYSLHLLWILSFPFTLFYVYSDLKYDYSQSRQVAQYIMENQLDQKEIVAYQSYSCCPIAPYLPKEKKLWYPHNQQYGTFITWDNDTFQYGRSYSDEEVIQIVDQKFSEQQQPLLLILSELVQGDRSNPRLRLLYHNTVRTVSSDERYHVYMLEKKAK